jgi:very-short-patch-repair endonuclease
MKDWELRRRQGFCSATCAKRHRAKTVVGKNHPLHKPKVPMRCVVCGTICMVKPSLVSRFRSCSRQCNGVLSQRAMPRVSSLETTMADLFTREGLAFESQYEIGQFVTDFAFPDARLIVECDGTYWHSLPGKRATDRRKDGFLKHNGWRVLRLPEADIRADARECLRRVVDAIHDDAKPPGLIVRKRTAPKRGRVYVQQSLKV